MDGNESDLTTYDGGHPFCKSVFKDGTTRTTKAQFTQKIIEMINRIERGKMIAYKN